MTNNNQAASAYREDEREKALIDEWRMWRKNKKKVWYLDIRPMYNKK